jgi:murein DD-endopeptidase MepM/ murein hydrolase activator NlpD
VRILKILFKNFENRGELVYITIWVAIPKLRFLDSFFEFWGKSGLLAAFSKTSPKNQPGFGTGSPAIEVILLKPTFTHGGNMMKKMSLLFCLLVSAGVFAQTAPQISMTLPLAAMGPITQPYGDSANFFTGAPWFHNGIDIRTNMRSPVLAAMSGIVSETGEDKSLGIYVVVDHNNGYKTIYGQLDEITVVKGRRVAQGETIALSGNTGFSTGPHLHFGVYRGEETIDPLSVLTLKENR